MFTHNLETLFVTVLCGPWSAVHRLGEDRGTLFRSGIRRGEELEAEAQTTAASVAVRLTCVKVGDEASCSGLSFTRLTCRPALTVESDCRAVHLSRCSLDIYTHTHIHL